MGDLELRTESTAPACPMLMLPPDVAFIIMEHLSIRTAVRVASTCKELSAACADRIAPVARLRHPPFSLKSPAGAKQCLHLRSRTDGDSDTSLLADGLICGALPSLRSLHVLYIGDPGAYALTCAALNNGLGALRELHLNDNGIGPAGMFPLAHVAATFLPCLEDLWLERNPQLGDLGVLALASAATEPGNFRRLRSRHLGRRRRVNRA